MMRTTRKPRSAAGKQARAEAARRAAQQARGRRRWTVAGVSVVVVGAVAAVVAASGNGGSGAGPSAAGPTVGGDLHALAAVNGSVYVSGHGGAGVSTDGGRTWQQLGSLDDKDGMGWAVSGTDVLVGGHTGLYRSSDGRSFSVVSGLPVSDVHGLGGAGQTIYLASPQGGVYVSADGGRSWKARGLAGAGIMGTIVVDAENPDRLLAPDMSAGVVASSDGGRTWTGLGGPSGAMSVARNPADPREFIAVGMGAAQRSTDGGANWTPMNTPAGIAVVTFDPSTSGRMLAAALSADRAVVYASDDDGVTWTRTQA